MAYGIVHFHVALIINFIFGLVILDSRPRKKRRRLVKFDLPISGRKMTRSGGVDPASPAKDPFMRKKGFLRFAQNDNCAMLMPMKRHDRDIAFEDALSDDWRRDLDVAEVSIGSQPMRYLAIAIAIVVLAIAGRIVFLGFNYSYYTVRAARNVAQEDQTPAPRGAIYDREGDMLADNKASFSALLDVRTFLENEDQQSSTLAAIQNVLNVPAADVWSLVGTAQKNDFVSPVVLADNLNQGEIVNLQALGLKAVTLKSDFARTYPNGQVFSAVIGYAGRVTAGDLVSDPSLKNQDVIGKTGLEAFYDKTLRGTPGVNITYANAAGQDARRETAVGAADRHAP